MKILKFNRADETELMRTATHEAGHAHVARALGLGGRAYVGGLREGICSCARPTGPGEFRHQSALGWAGIIAEALTGHNPVSEPLRESTRYGWRTEVLGKLASLVSAADFELIRSDTSLDAFELSFRLCREGIDLIQMEARRLAEKHREQVAEVRDQPARARSLVDAWTEKVTRFAASLVEPPPEPVPLFRADVVTAVEWSVSDPWVVHGIDHSQESGVGAIFGRLARKAGHA